MLFKKSQLGWRLLRQSWAYIQQHPQLLIPSVIGRGFFFLIITATGLLAWAVRTGKTDYAHWTNLEVLILYIVFLLIMWLGSIVATYTNAVLTFGIISAEQEKPVHLPQGFRAVAQRIKIIIYYPVVHFVFGLTNVFFRRKFKEFIWTKRLFSDLPLFYATFLIPSLLINEPADLRTTLQRSSSLMRRFAGKSPQIQYSFFWVSQICRLFAFIPTFVGYQINKPDWIMAGIVTTWALLLVISIALNAIHVVMTQAIYEYIAHAKTINHFRADDLAKTFIPGY
jgi:hypothetical protein